MADSTPYLRRPLDDPRGESYTQAELVKALGIERRSVTLWSKHGLPHKYKHDGRENLYHLPTVIRWLHRREIADDEDESPTMRLARVKADMIELEIAEKSGELIPANKVLEGWSRIILAQRSAFAQLTSIAPLLATCTGIEEMRGMLDSRIREILDRLASDPDVEFDDTEGDEPVSSAAEDDGGGVGDAEEDAV